MNPSVDKYLTDGCMRCKFGGTPKCKVLNWVEELEHLRQIALDSGLTEEIKWGVPVYTHKGKNVVSVNALKESANMVFFKGVLLTDEYEILQQQGNIQLGRIVKFKTTAAIEKLENVLQSYITEAIAIEEGEKKVAFIKKPEPIPDELKQAFEADPAFKKAFHALTPGRQRAYIIHFSQPKQTQTRTGRIEKYKAQIFDGVGLNDKYSC